MSKWAGGYVDGERIGRRLPGHRDEFRPRVATAEERRLLALPQVSVVLEVARTGCDGDGVPVVVVHQVRRGDGAARTCDITCPGRGLRLVRHPAKPFSLSGRPPPGAPAAFPAA